MLAELWTVLVTVAALACLAVMAVAGWDMMHDAYRDSEEDDWR